MLLANEIYDVDARRLMGHGFSQRGADFARTVGFDSASVRVPAHVLDHRTIPLYHFRPGVFASETSNVYHTLANLRVQDAHLVVRLRSDADAASDFDPAQVFVGTTFGTVEAGFMSLTLAEELRECLDMTSAHLGEDVPAHDHVLQGVWETHYVEEGSSVPSQERFSTLRFMHDLCLGRYAPINNDNDNSAATTTGLLTTSCGEERKFRLPASTLFAHTGFSSPMFMSVVFDVRLPEAMAAKVHSMTVECVVVPVMVVEQTFETTSTLLCDAKPVTADLDGIATVTILPQVFMGAVIDTLDVVDVQIVNRHTGEPLPSHLFTVIPLRTHTLVHVLPDFTWSHFLRGQYGFCTGHVRYDIHFQTTISEGHFSITQLDVNQLCGSGGMVTFKHPSMKSWASQAFLDEFNPIAEALAEDVGPLAQLLQEECDTVKADLSRRGDKTKNFLEDNMF